jgi:hypothetical protein
MNTVIASNGHWTVAQAQKLFTQQDDNEDMAIVDLENKAGLHWIKRWNYLVEQCQCPKMVAYDTVAARARKSRKTIQNYVRVYQYFTADQLESYMQTGITYLTAAVTREDPEAFLDEAMRFPNTNLETLLEEHPANEGETDEARTPPPYPSWGWAIGRRMAILPINQKQEVEGHLKAIETIFERNGIE